MTQNFGVTLTSWDRGESKFGHWENLLACLFQPFDQRQMVPDTFRLSRDVPSLLERLVQQ